MIKVLFDKKEVGCVIGSSMTPEEVLCFAFGLDNINDQKGLETLYKNNDFVCFDDGIYFLAVEDFEIIYS